MRCHTGDEITECFWTVENTVGIGGTNAELDVMIVQWLLNKTLRRLHYKSKVTKLSGCAITGNWDSQSVKAFREFAHLAPKFGFKLAPADVKGRNIPPANNLFDGHGHLSTMAALTAMALSGQHFSWTIAELPPVLRGCAHQFADVFSNSPLAMAS
jgi:hypothetical protein